MSDPDVKARQGAMVLIAVIGAGATPPVAAATPRRYRIGSDRLYTGRVR